MVMLFGQCNAPATFQRVMDRILRPLKLKYPYMIFVYMDDILIATPNDPALHRQIVHDVLDLLEQESFFLKPQKCAFEQTRVEYLGLLLDGETLRIDPSKIAGITKWPRVLKSVKEVRSTLGVLGYHRAFIPGFADIARPLLNLLKKGAPFIWTPECTAALDRLITLATTDPVLRQPNHNKPFKLEVDASQFATGTILYQRDSNGLRHPVGYDSSSLTKSERNYPIWDCEFLAIIRALEHWRYLLLGAKFIVDVFTDHKNLQYYRSPQKINCRLARYILTLGDYNIRLLHKPGASNRADALSRRPDHDTGAHDNDRVLALPDNLFLRAIATTDLNDAIIAA
jgi:hypothetical protein